MWRDNNDTRRFIKSIDTEVSHESSHKISVLPCVSHSREGERERYPDTENQSTVVRTGTGARATIMTRRPGTNPCLDTQA